MKISKQIPNHKLSVWSKFQVRCFNIAEVMPICVISTCYPQKNAPEDIENLEMQLKSF